MKLFSAAQIKQWDAYTIANEPVSSTDLMERAATACFNWLQQKYPSKQSYYFFCGKGNNGGDGLVIARLLAQQKHNVTVYILDTPQTASVDFNTNFKKLEVVTFNIHFITAETGFPEIPGTSIIIDALFGTGLNKPLSNVAAALAMHINKSGATIIAIDIPSGLFADSSSAGNTVITARHTLSFQQLKLAFLLQENEKLCGEVHVLDIGLHKTFANETSAVYNWTDTALIQSIYKPREKFTHKGTYGHAALIDGSYGMMGAAVLSANACLRSGAGKLTCFIPSCGYNIIQTAVPEAMCIITEEKNTASVNALENFDAIGIGPGLGMYPSNAALLKTVFSNTKKAIVIDADALNTLAENKDLLTHIPPLAVLTPHPKEFERLFGKTANDFERLQLALQKATDLNVYIILKGYHTFIATPEGKGYFNSTGNAGMATAGSGDVLTGIITGLLAQSYTVFEACILGVYLHGMAGDLAAEKNSQEAMIAGDITAQMGEAYKQIAVIKNPG